MPGQGVNVPLPRRTTSAPPQSPRRERTTDAPAFIRIAPKPPPSADQIVDALQALAAKRRERSRPNDLDARDPDFIVRVLPLLELFYDHYFRCETELACEIDARPMLAVANHNGMSGTPDMFCHMVAFWRRYGPNRRAYGLMHDIPFTVPWAGPWLNGCGAIAANPGNAARVLASGGQVLVFPGGDIDACKPYNKRYQIQFANRRGFVRTAIRARVPILPIVSVGAHSSLWLLSDGRAIANALGLPRSRWRSNVFPIGFALPWGIIFGNPIPHLPPPVKIHTRFGRPIEHGLAPEDADDREAVDWLYAEVVRVMQAMLDDLRREGRHGLFPRD